MSNNLDQPATRLVATNERQEMSDEVRQQALPTVRFTAYPDGYKCSEPRDQSGEYVKAEVALELLAACKWIVAIIDSEEVNPSVSLRKGIRMAKAAIARAERKAGI